MSADCILMDFASFAMPKISAISYRAKVPRSSKGKNPFYSMFSKPRVKHSSISVAWLLMV